MLLFSPRLLSGRPCLALGHLLVHFRRLFLVLHFDLVQHLPLGLEVFVAGGVEDLVVHLNGIDVVPAGIVGRVIKLLLEELVEVLAADGACGLGASRLRVGAHCDG